MGVFSKVFKSKDSTSTKSQGRAARAGPHQAANAPRNWGDAWTRKEVGAEEVQELLQVCTQELKSRALDMPFLLLPFRPESDSNGARTFIRNFFSSEYGTSHQYRGHGLYNELKIIEPMVLCSIMKWCWSRLSGGVVGWNSYELFRRGEQESHMAKHAFDTFIPLSVESEARKLIIFDFFELLAAIAANGKTNGLGGRKLSRLAGWWAFDHLDNGKGFDGGYVSWAQAADATSHLFFAYLRSLAPETAIGSTVSKLPRSLQALLAQTEYPPDTPQMLITPTSKVVMIVNLVSPTPFALLRRAKNFDYRDEDPALQTFSEYEDPLDTLTAECRRVLDSISSTNSTTNPMHELSLASPSTQPDASWSRFEDMGFSSLLDSPAQNGDGSKSNYGNPGRMDGIRSSAASAVHGGRPTTPSWADFLSSGFIDDSSNPAPSSFLLSPDKQLPPFASNRVQSSQSHVKGIREDNLEPGELASINRVALDETFWWVWISSLAGEEPPARKAAFGRCAFVETNIRGARWLVFEEQIKSEVSKPAEGAVVVQKKSRFASLTTKGRGRRSSTGRRPPVPKAPYQGDGMNVPLNRTTIGPDQAAKVQAAALALVQKQKDAVEEEEQVVRKRGRTNEGDDVKTQSVMTLALQPVIMKEAGPAMQWARKFDKEAVRQQYLGDDMAGKGGAFGAHSRNASSLNLATALSAGDATRLAQGREAGERELPPPPAVPETPAKDLPSSALTAAPVSSMDAVRSLQEHRTIPAEPQILHLSNKETSSEADATPHNTTSQIQRKPVNSVDLKNEGQAAVGGVQASTAPVKSSVDQQQPATPTQSAAVLAASIATRNSGSAQSSPSTAVGSSPTKAERKASTRGFRGMFNKRKTQTPETLAAQRAYNGSALSIEKSPVARSNSFLRRKQASPTSVTEAVESGAHSVATSESPAQSQVHPQADAPELSNIDDGEPGPEVTTDSRHFEPHHGGSDDMVEPPAPPFTRNPNDSSGRFSNFSQGPLEDTPAFAPEDTVQPVEAAREPTQAPPAAPVTSTSSIAPATSTQSGNQSSFQTRLAAFSALSAQPTPSAPSAPSSSAPAAAPSAYQTRLAALIRPEPEAPARPAPAAPAVRESPGDIPRDESGQSSITRSDFPSSLETATDRDTSESSLDTENMTALPAVRRVEPTVQASAPATESLAKPSPVPISRQPPPAPVESAADRWAQIRKNAAERRTSEDTKRGHSSSQKSQTQSIGTEKTDDGETSGEETIESRVARIKARVAELTGGNQSVTAR